MIYQNAPVRDRILAARDELGVPSGGYPAPVAECHAKLTALLDDLEGKDRTMGDHKVESEGKRCPTCGGEHPLLVRGSPEPGSIVPPFCPDTFHNEAGSYIRKGRDDD